MNPHVFPRSFMTGLVSLFAFLSIPLVADEPPGSWKDGVISMWDEKSENFVETAVRVWDSQPGASRQFHWEGDVDAEGYASGTGKLQWREADAPEYGSEGLLSVYDGSLVKGRRSGQGKIRFANGERYAGGWQDDMPSGWGERWFANGDYYAGEFESGRMEGGGVLVTAGSEVFEGNFRDGKRHGPGKVQLGDGVSYESEWVDGVETEASLQRREEALGQVGNENTIQIGLVSAVSKNEKFRRLGIKPLTYESYFEEGEFGFRPEAEFLEQYEKGGLVDSTTPEIGSLFMEMAFENRQSRQIVIERGEVEVIESVPDLAPYIYPLYGASGIQFDLANAGWGNARNCVFDFNLHRWGEAPEPSRDESYEFQIKLGDFESRTLKVDMSDAFRKCGVDVEFAREHQNDSMNFRGKWEKEEGDRVYGRFAKYDASGKLDSASVALHGRLGYEWTDARGENHSHSVLYTGFIQLIYLVEGGGDMGGHARFDVALPFEGENYRLPFSYSEIVPPFQHARFGLDLNSERSSFHRFRVVLHCSDGTILRSPACRVHLFRPRNIDAELFGGDGMDGEIVIPGDSPYLFPDSHERLLGEADLRDLTPEQLWKARNEIFVRRGYIFTSDRGKEFAAGFGELYQPVGGIDVVTPLFNEIERSNIEAIRAYESR